MENKLSDKVEQAIKNGWFSINKDTLPKKWSWPLQTTDFMPVIEDFIEEDFKIRMYFQNILPTKFDRFFNIRYYGSHNKYFANNPTFARLFIGVEPVESKNRKVIRNFLKENVYDEVKRWVHKMINAPIQQDASFDLKHPFFDKNRIVFQTCIHQYGMEQHTNEVFAEWPFKPEGVSHESGSS